MKANTLLVAPLLLALTSCVAKIGSTKYALIEHSQQTEPLLQQQVDTARRILGLKERKLDAIRVASSNGRAPASDAIDAEIEVEEARLRMLEYQTELEALRAMDKDD